MLLGLALNSTAKDDTESTDTSEMIRLPDTVVTGRQDSLIGIAESANEGTVGVEQFELRPMLRPGELLETVPGMIATQHAGGGKANQYFLRGFNLDHGTDFLTTLDGMPVNLPTHGHGQGYTDMNITIPELIRTVNYQKGVYFAENGDFSSAGAAHLETIRTLPHTLTKIEGGMYGFARGVFASSSKAGPGELLYAGELYHHDGPWKNPDDYQKINAHLAYNVGDETLGWGVTARAYHGEWNSSDQVATSAIGTGLIGEHGSLDDTTGGDSQRYSLQAEWHRRDVTSETLLSAFGFFYDMDLFSNFTYFLTDPVLGDQFEQVDERWVVGAEARHTRFNEWFDREVENTFGLQLRNDWIDNGLFNTSARQRTDKTDGSTGDTIAATVRDDDIVQTSVGLYYKNTIRWTEKFRSIAGLRGDLYHYDVDSRLAANSGDETDAIASPKLSLVFGPWADTEFYAQGGLGFHSNDGRGATTTIDPVTGDAVDPADPLVRTYGAEVGVRTLAIPRLQSTLSLWWLDVDSELLFVGDAGATEASRPSRRYGVEWANFYKLTDQWSLDADFSFSHAEFRDSDPAGDHIPGSIESVVAAGISYRGDSGFFGSLRLRWFGPRPLIEDDSVRSDDTVMLNALLGYRINETWTITAEVLNVLDRDDHDIDYYYESRVTPAAAANEEIHFHPIEPVQARIGVTATF